MPAKGFLTLTLPQAVVAKIRAAARAERRTPAAVLADRFGVPLDRKRPGPKKRPKRR